MSLDKKHLGSGRFIDANYPDYIVVRDVHEGDVKGRMYGYAVIMENMLHIE